MARSLLVEEILKTNDIVEYLSAAGKEPNVVFDGRYKYCCPLPSHNDDTPSFVVYLNKDTGAQDFHCFGCKAHGTIIHLKMAMENISFKQAIKSLGQDINIDDAAAVAHVLKQLSMPPKAFVQYEPEVLSWLTNRLIHRLLSGVSYASSYVEGCDKIMKLFDFALERLDLEQALDIYTSLGDLVVERLNQFAEHKEKDLLDTAAIYSRIK